MNPFKSSSSAQKTKDGLLSGFFALLTYLILGCTLFIFFDIAKKGLPVLMPVFSEKGGEVVDLDFLTRMPETLVDYTDENGEKQSLASSDFIEYTKANPDAVIENKKTNAYSGGGIAGPLVGTALLVIVCMVVALIVGVAAAVYLNEYAKQGRFVGMIRLAIMNLAGVPSIVFGLFGFAFFCLFPLPIFTMIVNEEKSLAAIPMFGGYLSFQGWGNSLLAGGLTLAVMVLPVIIAACEESLKAIPKGFREASLALGATKWQCIRTAVLPYATPGILTASVLGVTRVAGETAPIMFTAAVALKGKLPWQEADGKGIFWVSDLLTDSVQAMPYHIYTVAARIPRTDATAAMQDGSVFVFLLMVMTFASVSIYLRIHFRKKLKW
ncbi:MAG: phosphate ABC transporter permease PstA [Akkermansiaceae bacterium]|jgi:phosphate transport system permease protein|nr:phosphate ABC transporter permease PstA [Akkermansiaceae bacterium]MDP4645553.1 phosphate ABC transporter permease PstA [Akkermansiaceae bacterium]MDP4720362.1 phosphate ABC transporter permease PstA [Akkermansiaceae bacterium]MDP4779363.1 phosphate ABC transporter permease PstA [Akkermansiaceae bacterium]MDP4848653.1 phosphate ABC transporter permease PstA [Akkermansiaceae bacterium]